MDYDVVITQASLIDGSGGAPYIADVAIRGERIQAIGPALAGIARHHIDGQGLVLAPGFIDVHTHDDTNVIRTPEMQPKLSQGVTTVIVGNCGISAAPVTLTGAPPDPMNLLGEQADFCYPTLSAYIDAVNQAGPSVNVAALVGHTALRQNHMDDLFRAARPDEISAMRIQLSQALEQGALGLSSGLAYASANAAPAAEVMALVEELSRFDAIYTTHLRTEFEGILEAMEEAFATGRHGRVPVVISHLKCAGAGNWGRTVQTLASLELAARQQDVACDCYPYAASSSTLDLKQVTDDFDIFITWSAPHPELAGRTLAEIAALWQLPLYQAAERLMPAGAVYHCMAEEDVRRVLAHPLSMVGSDGLPNDPHPHPRLWGAFPRVLGHYSRDQGLFSLAEAVHKMTGLSASRFGLVDRGLLKPGYFADLVLFDPERIQDSATFNHPCTPAQGIHQVWVNGILSYQEGLATGRRQGRFLYPRHYRGETQ